MPLPWRRGTARITAAQPSWVSAQGWQRGELVIWGAHGGAGTTTLATWLQPAWDMGAMRPGPDAPYPANIARSRALVVACRNTTWSAQQATKAVAAVKLQGGQVAVLAVVSDGWPEPATATRRFQLLGPQAGAVIRVPFIPGLRLADDPDEMPLPRRARRALTQIRAAAGLTLSAP
ncbi:MAG: hypothetical protein ACRDPY_04210 [Streptosporangiaceae bacterium]